MLSLLSIRELNEKLSRDCAKKSKNEWEWKSKLKYAYTIQIQEQETEFNNFNQGNWNCLIENLVIYIGTTKYVSLIFRFCSFLFRLCTGAKLRPTTQKSHRSESWHPSPNPSGITTQNIHDYYLLCCLLCVAPNQTNNSSNNWSFWTYQLLTWSIVRPVSLANCFFCSSDGYGC